MFIGPGPLAIARRQASSSLECLKLFFTNKLCNFIANVIRYTNEEINLQKQKYKVTETVRDLWEEELEAFLQILNLAA